MPNKIEKISKKKKFISKKQSKAETKETISPVTASVVDVRPLQKEICVRDSQIDYLKQELNEAVAHEKRYKGYFHHVASYLSKVSDEVDQLTLTHSLYMIVATCLALLAAFSEVGILWVYVSLTAVCTIYTAWSLYHIRELVSKGFGYIDSKEEIIAEDKHQ